MLSEKLLEAAGNSTQPTYIEDVFSTYLYTGNGSTQTITNDIDLSGKGGLVWIKRRNGIRNHALIDTVRGASVGLSSNTTDANTTYSPAVMTSFNSNGFSLNSNIIGNNLNDTYASWTFREQPKFFDVVTYTGDGTNNRAIPHNLKSSPGMVIIKNTSSSEDWAVWHASVGGLLYFNKTAAKANYYPISADVDNLYVSAFVTGVSSFLTNYSGETYVAYLFAHNAGGFGLTGTDNVISCGSFTTDASGNATVNLGYEPQWVMVKATSAIGSWLMEDTMRGLSQTSEKQLFANSSAAESSNGSPNDITINATGFVTANSNVIGASITYIYIAIRRGPMKTPTTGTSVFNPNTSFSAISSGVFGVTTGFPVDSLWWRRYDTTTTTNYTNGFMTRLQGSPNLQPYNTTAEGNYLSPKFDYNTQVAQQAENAGSQIYWSIKRAPGFFDVVCYTGTGSNLTKNHNLGVKPELMIMKNRSGTPSGSDANWHVFYNFTTPLLFDRMYMNTTASAVSSDVYSGAGLSADPTSTTFSVDSKVGINTYNYVAYLFASCPGVSKVTSFTGNGSSQTINCGFTAGARFVLIKRTDSTGDWYIWDSARGIVSGNDPHLSLNSTAAEVTTDDTIDTDSTGFIVNQVSATNCNVNGASYIVLAVA